LEGTPKKIMMVAGEASGDLHGSALVRELRKLDPSACIFGMGGPLMEKEGMTLLKDISGSALIGFSETLRHLPSIWRTLSYMKKALERERPNILIPIDYPGFNLRLAKSARKLGIPVLYYIAPQVWAWGASRIPKIAERVDRIAVIFPFEVPIFRRYGIDVEFVGHPLLDIVKPRLSREDFLVEAGLEGCEILIGILPGSRAQEIARILPVMLEAAEIMNDRLNGAAFALGAVETVREGLYLRATSRSGTLRLKVLRGMTYEIMKNADLLLVASGTATLESAILGTPMIVIYKTSTLSYLIGRAVVRIPNIALANVVAGRRVVPEYIQGAADPKGIAEEALDMLGDSARMAGLRRTLLETKGKLGSGGAAKRVAEMAMEMISIKA